MASIIINVDGITHPFTFDSFVEAFTKDLLERVEDADAGISIEVRSEFREDAAFRSDAEKALKSWWEDDIPSAIEMERNHPYARGMLDLLMSTFAYEEASDWEVARGDVWITLFPQLVPKTFDEVAAANGWDAEHQNEVLRAYIAGTKMITLDEYAVHVAEHGLGS